MSNQKEYKHMEIQSYIDHNTKIPWLHQILNKPRNKKIPYWARGISKVRLNKALKLNMKFISKVDSMNNKAWKIIKSYEYSQRLLLERLEDLQFDSKLVFKKCCRPNALVIMCFTENTKTTEKRNGIIDFRYAQFRANELKVVKILELPNLNEILMARSLYNNYFQYEVGQIVKVNDFGDDLNFVSGEGIHYFHSFIAAVCFGFVLRDIYTGTWYNYNYNGLLLSTVELINGLEQ